MGRAPCCDKAIVKKGPWSPDEDITLKSYLERHGTGGSWIALPQKAGLNRCGKSCRLRWLNYLRPDIKHGGFTDEEDNIICALYNSIGSRWSVIASQLQGRTDNDVKNYWNTKLKKKILAGKINLNCNPNIHPTASSPSPAMDTRRKQDINVGSLSSFSNPVDFPTPGMPMVPWDYGTLSLDVPLPLDYSSWWASNGIDEDYHFLTNFGLGSSYDILLSGVIGPNNNDICSTSGSFMHNTIPETKPHGMNSSVTN